MRGAEVAIVGNGGREATLAHVLDKSPEVKTVYGLNGNPYFDSLEKGFSVGVKPNDTEGILAFARQENLDMIIFGPEAPLIAGAADVLRAEGVRVLGPSQEAARLEGSKIFAQEFNERHGISCPKSLKIARSEYEALAFIDGTDPSKYVIKADGEAGGKGVGVFDTQEEMYQFARHLFGGAFSNAAKNGVVFQERATGPEVSSFWLFDKNGNRVNLGYSQDHKRQLNGDKGPNTGGMGAYSPVPESIFGKEQMIQDQIIADQVAAGCFREGMPYEGFLYNGLMITEERVALGSITHKVAKVIEYNVRFGDPEAEVCLPLLQRAGVDMYEVLDAAVDGKLDEIKLPSQLGEVAVTICLADGGYPESTTPGTKIHGLDNKYENAIVFHAGVKKEDDGSFSTAGGRLVYASGFGENYDEAYANAEAVFADEPDGSGVYVEGAQRRSDIAHQARTAA